MKIGFCGSGHFAEICLKNIASKVGIDWVVTNKPRPAGRGMALQRTPVHNLADELGIPIKTTSRLSSDEELLSWIKEQHVDIILVIDFGHIVKEPMLSCPTVGCVNIHPSRLPEFRGAAPLQRTLLEGRKHTAVTIFKLDTGMDTGPILDSVEVTIDNEDNYLTLLEKTANAGSCCLVEWLLHKDWSEWIFTPQSNENVSVAPKIEKSEGKIDWTITPDEICNKLRGIGETPGVYFLYRGNRIRLYKAEHITMSGKPGCLVSVKKGYPVIACGRDAIKLIELQPAGKKRQEANAWLCGARIKKGDYISEV